MAVQDPGKAFVFCEKCFSKMPRHAEFCENCGAPLGNSPGADGSDAAVYPKLAQANLLRMRKQYKEAEDICLEILHQFPHNVSANTLLGDMSEEQGLLEPAVEWYELALDIRPDSTVLKEKLEALREQKENKVVETTAEQLGLPLQRSNSALIAALAILGIAALCVAGYFIYRASQPTSGRQALFVDPNTPVVIPPDSTGNNTGTSGGDKPGPQTGTQDDQELTKTLTEKAADGAFLVDARYAPAVDGVTLTYTVPPDQNERTVGASLAMQTFGLVKDNLNRDISQVELRAIRDKKLFYSALVRKADYEETLDEQWQAAHKDDQDALLKKILTNEKYMSGGAVDQSPNTEGSTPGGTTSGGDTSTTGTTPPSSTTTGSPPASPSTTGTPASAPPTTGSNPPPADSGSAKTTGASG